MASLFSEIHSDWCAHKKDWTKPGFRALAYYRFGVWRMGVKTFLVRAPLSIIYRFFYRRARNLYGIEIPYTAVIGQRVVFEHQHGIVIHGAAVIGDECIIRQGVTIGNRDMQNPHDAPVLGCRVNVGAGAKILGKINIGDNVNVGANSVVLHNVPDNSTVVGIPARQVKKA